MKLEVMNETRVELAKTNEFCHVVDKLQGWPCSQKVVLGFFRLIAVDTDVNPNKFKPLGEEVAFAEVQQ